MVCFLSWVLNWESTENWDLFTAWNRTRNRTRTPSDFYLQSKEQSKKFEKKVDHYRDPKTLGKGHSKIKEILLSEKTVEAKKGIPKNSSSQVLGEVRVNILG